MIEAWKVFFLPSNKNLISVTWWEIRPAEFYKEGILTVCRSVWI